MKKINLSAVFIIGLFFASGVLALGAGQAHAYCVYNDTEQYISEVQGESCFRCLNTSMSPHSKSCCPGDNSGCRGLTWITVRIPNDPYHTEAKYKHFGAQVTAHGWVRIKGAGQMLSGEVYNDSGSLLWSGPLINGRKN